MNEFGIPEELGRTAQDAAAAAEALRATDPSIGIEMADTADATDLGTYGDFGATGLGVSDEEDWEQGGTAAVDRTEFTPDRPVDTSALDKDALVATPAAVETQAAMAAEPGEDNREVDGETTAAEQVPAPDAELAVGAVALTAADHELVVDEAAEVMEVAATPEKRPQDVVKIRVIPTTHLPEYGETIAAALEGCHTAAFELAGGTPEWRASVERLADAAHGDPDPFRKVMATLRLKNAGCGYIPAVVRHLPASVREIKLADFDNDSPIFPKAVASDEQLGAWSFATCLGTIPHDSPGGSRELGEAFLRQSARINIGREQLMAEQIAAIAADVATRADVTADNPHTIGLVTGAAHGSTPSRLQANGFDVTTTPTLDTNFITGLPLNNSVYADIILGLVASGDPNGPLDPALLDRATVERAYLTAGATERIASAVAQTLTDAEVQTILRDFDTLKQSGGPASETWKADVTAFLTDALVALIARVKRERGH